MTMWVLDDGPFSTLARVYSDAWNWPADSLHVVDEVAAAASQDRSGRRQKLLGMISTAGKPVVHVHEILDGSAASDMLFDYLRKQESHADKDLGEDASIAFCAKEAPEAVLVLSDRRGAFIALAELGRNRVATPFDLWEDLKSRGLVSPEEAQALHTATLKGDSSLPGIPRRFTR
jgi:hypothetical protein